MGKHLDAQLKGETVPYVKAVYRMAHAVVRRVDNPLLMSDILFHMTVMGAHWRADLRTLHGPCVGPATQRAPTERGAHPPSRHGSLRLGCGGEGCRRLRV